MTSPASAPIMVKPRMRSLSRPTIVFMKPCFSSVASVRKTALIGSLATRVAFAQSHVRELRVGEHAVRHQAIARAARSPGQVVPDNPEVIAGNVRELRAAGAIPHGPDFGRGGFQPVVDPNISARVQGDAR